MSLGLAGKVKCNLLAGIKRQVLVRTTYLFIFFIQVKHRTYDVPDNILGAEDTAVNESRRSSAYEEFTCY